jgi:hypothetical protein
MKRLWLGCLNLWTVSSAATITLTVLLAGSLLTGNATPWNFPGDPPLFDAVLYPAVISCVVSIPLWLVVRRRPWGLGHIVSGIEYATTMVSWLLLLVCTAGILERHGDRWTAVRNGIRQYSDAIATELGDRNRILTSEEFSRLHDKYIPEAVSVSLPGYGVVQLRMAHGVYPYVGVDFCCGGHALFDPRTMVVTYSD